MAAPRLNPLAPALSPEFVRRHLPPAAPGHRVANRPLSAVTNRWVEWLPIVTLHIQSTYRECLSTAQRDDLLATYRDCHERWLCFLTVARRIPISTVRRHVLDDPCLGQAGLDARLRQYLESRSRSRSRSRKKA